MGSGSGSGSRPRGYRLRRAAARQPGRAHGGIHVARPPPLEARTHLRVRVRVGVRVGVRVRVKVRARARVRARVRVATVEEPIRYNT